MIEASLITQIDQLVTAANHILVATHMRPDGDALGSLTAVGQWLTQKGKSFEMCVDEGIHNRFQYLPLADDVRHKPQGAKPFDLLISVDCGDACRMGDLYENLTEIPPIINIDHHVTNPGFGLINYIHAQSTSTCEMLYELFVGLDLEITEGIGVSLLTGIITDTQTFRIPTTSARTLDIAGHLVATGADLSEITLKAMLLEPESTAYLWKALLNNFDIENGIAYASVTMDDKLNAGYDGTGSAGLNSFLANIKTAQMAVVMTEFENNVVRVSFRSRPPINVANIAQHFGGGGHAQAAGCTIHAPLEEAVRTIVDYSKAYLKTHP